MIRKAASLLVEALERRVLFNNYIVNSGADSGAGSLRDAIAQANATAEDDTITLVANPSLSSGQLVLTAGGGVTTISSGVNGAGITQSGGSSGGRLLRIEAGASAVITDVAFSSGSASGTTSDAG